MPPVPLTLTNTSTPTARLSGVLYNAYNGSTSITSMPANASVGTINVINTATYGAGTFTPVGDGGYFTMPTNAYFEMAEVIGRDTWTMYFVFNIGSDGTVTMAGADPNGRGNIDSVVGFGGVGNNMIGGIQSGEMFFSAHHSSQTQDGGVHTDDVTWNDGSWHWVEFESSNSVAKWTMVTEDGSSWENTDVYTGFGRDSVAFKIFCAQGCDQSGLKIAEVIVYNEILPAQAKAANREYLSSLLAPYSPPAPPSAPPP
jgi:hypothetical protein